MDLSITLCPYYSKYTKGHKRIPVNSFILNHIITISLFQNKIQENETQCTNKYLTFNYVTPAHDLDLNILPAYLPYRRTVNAPSASTRCSNLLVCTLLLSFSIA